MVAECVSSVETVPGSPQVLGCVVELLVCPIYTETNQLPMEFSV